MLKLFLLFGLEGETLLYAGMAAGAVVLLIVVLAIVLGVRAGKKRKSTKSELTAQPPQPQQEPVEAPAPEQPVEAVEPAPEESVQSESEPELDEPVQLEAKPVFDEMPESEEVSAPISEPEPVVEPEPEEPVQSESEPEPEPEILTPVSDEDDSDDKDDDKEEAEEEEKIRKVARIDGHVRYIIIKYNKSFTAKIIQSSDVVKNYYSEIKNELLSYKGVKARMSWKGETFYSGRTTYAKLCVRGKCLGLFLALDAKDYAESKYIVDDMYEIATYEKTPCLYRIKNDRRVKYSKELIATVMGDREQLPEPEVCNWAEKYPYEETQPLVDRGLIKELTEEDAQSGDVFLPRDCVLANEVDELMQDDVAVALVEETEEFSDKTKSDIVNIDTLSKCFENGETATLEEMKKRIPAINRKATYIKVLARGTLDKKLTVIADSFSIEAVKMILLTGGNVVKKKNS